MFRAGLIALAVALAPVVYAAQPQWAQVRFLRSATLFI